MMLHSIKSGGLFSNFSPFKSLWKRPMTSMMQHSPPCSYRNFANIDFKAIKPENSVLKVYKTLLDEEQIRVDPKQMAVVNMLDKWQQNFIEQETRITEFQDEYTKQAEFGQNAKKLKKKGAGKFHNYNTEMHTAMGKREMDPHAKARLKIIEMYEDLQDIKMVYVWGDPGSGKSFIT